MKKLILTLSSLMLPFTLLATETGIGRSITGQQVVPEMGAYPLGPGWKVTFNSIYYEGKFSANKEAPTIGSITEGLNSVVWYNLAMVTRAWDSYMPKITFASAFGVPLQYTKTQATLIPPRAVVGSADNSTQFGDLIIDPIKMTYHSSSSHHFSLSTPVYVPTGEYTENRLANAGLNYWTFAPTLTYSYLRTDIGLEFTPLISFEFNSENKITDYQSGTVFRLESLISLKVIEDWRLGAVGGLVQQVSDDQGTLANQLNGFRGRSIGVGPFVGWKKKIEDYDLDFNFRWVPEFSTRNRPKGNGYQLGMSLMF